MMMMMKMLTLTLTLALLTEVCMGATYGVVSSCCSVSVIDVATGNTVCHNIPSPAFSGLIAPTSMSTAPGFFSYMGQNGVWIHVELPSDPSDPCTVTNSTLTGGSDLPPGSFLAAVAPHTSDVGFYAAWSDPPAPPAGGEGGEGAAEMVYGRVYVPTGNLLSSLKTPLSRENASPVLSGVFDQGPDQFLFTYRVEDGSGSRIVNMGKNMVYALEGGVGINEVTIKGLAVADGVVLAGAVVDNGPAYVAQVEFAGKGTFSLTHWASLASPSDHPVGSGIISSDGSTYYAATPDGELLTCQQHQQCVVTPIHNRLITVFSA